MYATSQEKDLEDNSEHGLLQTQLQIKSNFNFQLLHRNSTHTPSTTRTSTAVMNEHALTYRQQIIQP